MASAFAVRSQIETALADRIPSALTPAPRILREVIPTGIDCVDDALNGGLPVGALTEMIGPECSGRTSLALSFVAQITRSEKVCAWVDVSNGLSPESAAACGVDIARLLWVRCGLPHKLQRPHNSETFTLPAKYMVPPRVKKGLHGGGMGSHPRDEAKGMDDAVSGLLRPEIKEAKYVKPQRMDRVQSDVFESAGCAKSGSLKMQHSISEIGHGRPWSRLEQALRVTDLLLQAGGFAAIVLDMGSFATEHVSRIPLATWFRYRAAAERTQSSVLLLTQYACSKSSAGLVLQLKSGDAVSEGATVMAGFERRLEVSRQRFADIPESDEKVAYLRKPPRREGIATWHSGTTWAGRR